MQAKTSGPISALVWSNPLGGVLPTTSPLYHREVSKSNIGLQILAVTTLLSIILRLTDTGEMFARVPDKAMIDYKITKLINTNKAQ